MLPVPWDWTSASLAALACAFLVHAACDWIHWKLVRRRGLPSGPTGLPFIGYIPFLVHNYETELKRLFAKHGKVICLRLSSRPVVFVSDCDVVRKIMISEAFAARPPGFHPINAFSPPNLTTWTERNGRRIASTACAPSDSLALVEGKQKRGFEMRCCD